MTFRLSDKEYERYSKFCKKHSKCFRKKGKYIRITFIPCGIGNGVEVTCPNCGKTKEITDYKSW